MSTEDDDGFIYLLGSPRGYTVPRSIAGTRRLIRARLLNANQLSTRYVIEMIEMNFVTLAREPVL